MTNGNGVSRGDRNRNARLARLRELVPVENAIVGIDLADPSDLVPRTPEAVMKGPVTANGFHIRDQDARSPVRAQAVNPTPRPVLVMVS